MQFSASLGQYGALVSNGRIQGNIPQYKSFEKYLIMALYDLRNWYNGGVLIPSIPITGTISAYWELLSTDTETTVPLFVNVVCGSTIVITAANIQAVLPAGYIVTVVGTGIYIECQYTQFKVTQNPVNEYAGLNYIYWVTNSSSGSLLIDYLPSLFYEQAASIINKCKVIQNVITLADMEYDNAYVSLGLSTQSSIPNPTTCFNWLNFANGISVNTGI